MSEETKKTEEQVDATEVKKTAAKAEKEIKATEEVAETPKVEEVIVEAPKVSPEEFLENFLRIATPKDQEFNYQNQK